MRCAVVVVVVVVVALEEKEKMQERLRVVRAKGKEKIKYEYAWRVCRKDWDLFVLMMMLGLGWVPWGLKRGAIPLQLGIYKGGIRIKSRP